MANCCLSSELSFIISSEKTVPCKKLYFVGFRKCARGSSHLCHKSVVDIIIVIIGVCFLL